MDADTDTERNTASFGPLLLLVFLVPWLISVASDGQLTYWRGVAGAVAFVLVAEYVVTLASVLVMKK